MEAFCRGVGNLSALKDLDRHVSCCSVCSATMAATVRHSIASGRGKVLRGMARAAGSAQVIEAT